METLEEMESRITQLEAILENRVTVVDMLVDVCSKTTHITPRLGFKRTQHSMQGIHIQGGITNDRQ
jgi:hypothetical protein